MSEDSHRSRTESQSIVTNASFNSTLVIAIGTSMNASKLCVRLGTPKISKLGMKEYYQLINDPYQGLGNNIMRICVCPGFSNRTSMRSSFGSLAKFHFHQNSIQAKVSALVLPWEHYPVLRNTK